MTQTFKIAGIGEALWDVHGDHYTFGGAPANVACHCQAFGAQAFAVSCVGQDDLGTQAIDFLNKQGVDTSCLAVSADYETGVVLIELDSEGVATYEIKKGVAWDNIPFTAAMADLAPTLDAVCFGSLAQRSEASRLSINTFLEAMRPDSLRVFDINIRLDYYNDDILRTSLNHANALKVNDEELPILAKLADVDGTQEEQLRGLVEAFGLKLAILTCGGSGAHMATPDDICFERSPNFEPLVSTVGAGDSFTATSILGYLKGLPLAEINRRANTIASYVCTQVGAVPDIPAEYKGVALTLP